MVRYLFRFLLVFGALTLCFTSPSHAEIKIAVVDVDAVLSESLAAKSIKTQVDEKRKGFLDDVKAREGALRKEQQAIEAKRGSLSKDELIKKAQEFEKARLDARQSIQEQKSRLDKAYARSMNSLTQAIFEVCQEISDEGDIDLVITRQNIIVGNMSLDITKEVLTRMNKKLPKLKLEVE